MLLKTSFLSILPSLGFAQPVAEEATTAWVTTTASGETFPASCVCLTEHDPVVCSNGVTYSNGCQADCENAVNCVPKLKKQVLMIAEPAFNTECICPMDYDPVVCSNGRTYSNDCDAGCNNAVNCVSENNTEITIDINGVYVIQNQHWKGNLAFDPDSDHHYAGSHGRTDVLANGALLDWNQLFTFEYCNDNTGVKIKSYKHNNLLSLWHKWHNVFEDYHQGDHDNSQCFQLVPVESGTRYLIKSMHNGAGKDLVYQGVHVGPTFYNTPGNSLVGVPMAVPQGKFFDTIQWNIRYIGKKEDYPLDTKPKLDLNGFGGISGVFTIENNQWKGNLAFDADSTHYHAGKDGQLDVLLESASINVNSPFKSEYESQLFFFENCDDNTINNYSGDNLLVKIRTRKTKKKLSIWTKWNIKFEPADQGDHDSSQCFELVPVVPSPVKNRFMIKSMHVHAAKNLVLQGVHVGPTLFGAPGNSIIGVPETNPRNSLWDSIKWNINFYRFEFDLPEPERPLEWGGFDFPELDLGLDRFRNVTTK